MRREPIAGKTGILQIFGIKTYQRWYLPAWAWISGLFISYIGIIPALLWVDLFTIEGVAV
jgi:hypothetical protein